MKRSPVGSIVKIYKVRTTKNRRVYIEYYLCVRKRGDPWIYVCICIKEPWGLHKELRKVVTWRDDHRGGEWGDQAGGSRPSLPVCTIFDGLIIWINYLVSFSIWLPLDGQTEGTRGWGGPSLLSPWTWNLYLPYFYKGRGEQNFKGQKTYQKMLHLTSPQRNAN